MKYPAIRLFVRSVYSWKSNSQKEALKEINEFIKDNIQHRIQCVETSFIETKRKRKPFDVEVSYWDWQTIKQMVNHYGEKEE